MGRCLPQRDLFLDWLLQRAARDGTVEHTAEAARPWIVWTYFFSSRISEFIFGRFPMRFTCAICGERSYFLVRCPRWWGKWPERATSPERELMKRPHRHPGLHSRPMEWAMPLLNVDALPRNADVIGILRQRVIEGLQSQGLLP